MNFKKFISGVSALTIAASAFAGMAVTASAYSLRLSMNTSVAGYNAKTLYSFTDNSSGMMPTDGDLRYRDAGYGLFNYGSGNRGADVTMTVSAGDIILIDFQDSQNRNVTVNSVTNGTKNASLTASTGYQVFDISADANKVNFNVGRAGCILGVLVMEKDTTAQTADYTLSYKNNGTTVKTVNGTEAVGAQINTDASFIVDGAKYVRADGEPTSFTIASGENSFVVNVDAVPVYNYSGRATIGNSVYDLGSGSGFAGDTVKVAYPHYINVDGTLYSKGATGSEYNASATLTENNQVITVDGYTETAIDNVVFLSEGEDIAGLTASTANNTRIRSSKSGSAYASNDTTITTLPAGKYQIYAVLFSASSGGTHLSFELGNNEFMLETSNNTNWFDANTDELTITETSDLVFKKSGGNNAAIDYIYIVKTGDATTEDAFTFTQPLSALQDLMMYVTRSSDNLTAAPVAVSSLGSLEGTTLTGTGDAQLAIIFENIPESWGTLSVVLK